MSREMKDSGIEWIGQIPERWDLIRLENCMTQINEKNTKLKMHNILSLSKKNGVTPYEDRGNQGNKSKEDLSEYKLAYKNTIIANSMNILIGSVGISYYDGCVSPVYYVFKNNTNANLKFLNYIMQTTEFQKQLRRYANGILEIRLRVSYEDLVKQKIPLPPLSEQQKIADYLDEKVKEIDNAIEKTKETIELYKKYKQSIIYKTVCKGIDNHHLKNTGSKYWVKIPIEWQMVKVKRIFEIVKRIAGEEGYTILSITQKGIKEKDISHNEGQVAADYSNYQFVYPGDFAMNHMDLLTGWVDISKYFGVTSPDYRVFRLKYSFQHDNRYWLYVMQTCYMNKIFYSLARGVSTLGRWRLQAESFNNFEVPVPTLEEQKQIADYLDDKISSIDGLINYKEKFITQLENYKKSLIYEYVTGKKEI